MRVDPRRAAELGTQCKCITFNVRPSPSGLVVHLDELRKLFTIEEGLVGYILQGRWGVHFLERGTRHKGFFADAPQLGWEPDVRQVHTVREGRSPYGNYLRTRQVDEGQAFAILAGNRS